MLKGKDIKKLTEKELQSIRYGVETLEEEYGVSIIIEYTSDTVTFVVVDCYGDIKRFQDRGVLGKAGENMRKYLDTLYNPKHVEEDEKVEETDLLNVTTVEKSIKGYVEGFGESGVNLYDGDNNLLCMSHTTMINGVGVTALQEYKDRLVMSAEIDYEHGTLLLVVK